MGELFASGYAADGALAVMLIELVVLVIDRRGRGRLTRDTRHLLELMVTLAAGAALVLALRAALIGSPWPMIAAWLALAGLAHVGELWLRCAAAGRDRMP
jgi:hypothetical protein